MGLIHQIIFAAAFIYTVSSQGQGLNLNTNQLNDLMKQLRNRMLQRMLLNSQQNRASSAASTNSIVEPTPQLGNSGGVSNLAGSINNLRRRQDVNRLSNEPSSVIQWQAAGQSRNKIDVTTPPSAQSSIRISINRKNDISQNAIDKGNNFAPAQRQPSNTPSNVQPVAASLAHLLRSVGRNSGVSSAAQNRISSLQTAGRSRPSAASSSSRFASSGGTSSLASLATAGAMRGKMSDMLDTHLDHLSDMAEAGMLGMRGMGGMGGMGMGMSSGMMGMGFPGMSGGRSMGGFGMLPFGFS